MRVPSEIRASRVFANKSRVSLGRKERKRKKKIEKKGRKKKEKG